MSEVKRDINGKVPKVVDIQNLQAGGTVRAFMLETLSTTTSKYCLPGYQCYQLICGLDISTLYPTMRFVRIGNNCVTPLSGDEHYMRKGLMQERNVSKMATYYVIGAGDIVADYKFCVNPQTGHIQPINLNIYSVPNVSKAGSISCKYVTLGVQVTANIAEKINYAIRARGILPH